MQELIYIAAHGAYDQTRTPLGGGMAVANALLRAWTREGRFRITLLAPGDCPPAGVMHVRLPRRLPGGVPPAELVRLSTLRYARFCRDFSRETTAYLEGLATRTDPSQVCVLCNDISEGPDFAAAARLGFPIVTLLHVDVVDFFTRFYLRRAVPPARLTRLYERLCRAGMETLVPGVLRLVFGQQRDMVAHSRRLVVPSRAMAATLRHCYPSLSPERVAILPWGVFAEEIPEADVAAAAERLTQDYALHPEDTVLLTLSRISPEKGIHRALEALLLWEREEDPALAHLVLCICGDAAFMQGQAYLNRLRELAGRLQRVRVIFPGYVAGANKRAWFRRADLYLFLSEHESYGLTLVEALRAGVPALTSNHNSAADLVPPEAGQIVECGSAAQAPARILAALRALLADREQLRVLGQGAARQGARLNFARAADELAEILTEAGESVPFTRQDKPIRKNTRQGA